MVELSRIMRKVGLRLYTGVCPVEERLSRVAALDDDLKCWQEDLPTHLQLVNRKPAEPSLKPRNFANSVSKQSVVLHLRTVG